MDAGICPICTEQVEQATEALAHCGACHQPVHEACLQQAVRFDSRCPLCREDLAIVGYRSKGATTRPQQQRFNGDERQRMQANELIREIRILFQRLQQLERRIDRALLSKQDRTLDNLIADVSAFILQSEGLRTRSSDSSMNLPEDFRIQMIGVASKIHQLAIRQREICMDVRTIRSSASIEAISQEHSAITKLRRPAASVLRQRHAPASAVRRRPAAVRRRPATASGRSR
eukprot:TRINITY_DN106386_c0_g1_i1.p1 TRINITY_DN106386_c0_g1~~TRINITY_DN106386_c0_g1_i1.p1  ORF type:complete len:253 (-),score=28.62 TRINITY_DN106386_c0_g1_i1:81-773(-)